MNEEFGKIYKTIRKNKGLTQDDVCKGKISRATLSRLENEKEIPHFPTFTYLLEQLHMEFDEFMFLYNSEFPNERNHLMSEFYLIISNSELEPMKKLKENCLNYLQYSKDESIQKIMNILEIYVNLAENMFSTNVSQIALKIWNEVETKKEWYFIELELINHILFFLPVNIVFDVTDRVLDRLEEYSRFKRMNTLEISMLINLSYIYIENKRMNQAIPILEIALKKAKSLKRYDCLAICSVRLGYAKNDNSLIQKGFKLLEITDEKYLSLSLSEEMKAIIK
ncbi:MAG: helix-turn-helix domain-containing protein [Streptococcaceae bacterium]|jgi:transcriptional regulator with XRE-family HTH domain|nr:helix-turn-helix domain-containing protein [Streptococcaceae bacterium]